MPAPKRHPVFSPDRRRLIRGAWRLALAGLLAPPLARAAATRPRFATDPFALGIASGSPRPDGMVLWTRLAPDPLAAAGGMGPAPVAVRWEVAADDRFGTILRSGSATARADMGHSVHVEVDGLAPARPYWFRFMAGDAVSGTGTTRTAPAPGARVDRLRFAIASCQQYEQGWYAAHRHMASEDLDLVVFLGDYIYESSWGRNHVRKHASSEPYTLDEYRARHAQYKSDPDLQRMHAAAPWIVTWDDHEVDNDYAADRSEHVEANFLLRRAAAYRAYYEHMPLPRAALPIGPDMRLHAAYDYGSLARFHVLDDRQHRAPQACPREDRRGGSNVVDESCEERLDPTRSMLGAAQERWLLGSLDASRARWNIIAQQTLMAQAARRVQGRRAFWTDGWDGYPHTRRRLLEHLATHRTSNPLVVSGDVHTHYVADLRPDFDDPHSPVVAAEFCGTSITSQGWSRKRVAAVMQDNPHLRHADSSRRGYVVIDLEPGRALATLRGLDSEKDRDSDIRTLARYAVEDGRPGVQAA